MVPRARKGDGNALEAIDYKGEVQKHPVCAEILKNSAAWLTGRDLRRKFAGAPYGWQQDTTDGAILVLAVTGQLRAKYKDEPQQAKDLDQSRIGVTDFRAESVVIPAKVRIELRKLFQTAGVKCKTNEEPAAAPAFVTTMLGRAQAAGGDPPAPERPNTAHLKEIESLTGNEQLTKLHQLREQLTNDAKDWEERGRLIVERRPRWQSMQSLLAHAQGMAVAEEVKPQADAILSGRSLLADPDQVPPLCAKLTQSLRKALTEAHAECAKVYDGLHKALADHELWQRLSSPQGQALLAEQGLRGVPEIRVGNEEEVLASLEANGLDGWVMLRDALPERFAKALKAAAKLLEPKAVHLKLPPGTLRNEADVDAWLEKARKEILKAMKHGPVVV